MALWDKIGSRGNVEDRRGLGATGAGLSVGGIALLLAINYFSGGSVTDVLPTILNGIAPTEQISSEEARQYDGTDSYELFASQVVGSTDDTWTRIFSEQGKTYQKPKLVIFRGSTQSGCGGADSSTGPHYCPRDSTMYLDETFFDELTSRLGAKGGDVAQAYVIAHEVGHHVQNQLGASERVEQEGTNEASVKLELQADCYAGVWAYGVQQQGVFEPAEINEAIDAAAAVGDDRIQQKAEGRVTPESWTHGSSEQRVAWFTRGFESGNPASCDTFAG